MMIVPIGTIIITFFVLSSLSMPHFRKWIVMFCLLGIAALSIWYSTYNSKARLQDAQGEWNMQALRKAYERDQVHWPRVEVDSGIEAIPLAPLPEMVWPESNPYNEKTIALGKMLFFDPILSTSGQIACASCHDSELGWADGRSTSIGHKRSVGRRNAPTILNVGYLHSFFWDGRAGSLEEQALIPIQDPMEMDSDIDTILFRLNRDRTYHSLFAEAFHSDTIKPTYLAKALAAYQRTIVSRRNKLDRFILGNYQALSNQEILGLHLFRTKAKCMNCHHGPLMTDHQFHNDGFTLLGRPMEDVGRYGITKLSEDIGRFKTPGLRDIAFTSPYMHNGIMPDLEGVIEMYNQGMPQPIPRSVLASYNGPLPESSPLLHKLHLTEEEKEALVAFLHAISTRPQAVRIVD